MFTAAILALIALIGISRLLLGVHYVSDVVGAWAVGVLWLGLTTFAFQLTAGRRAAVTGPGCRRARTRGPRGPETGRPEPDSPRRRGGRAAAGLLIAWILIVGLVTGLGSWLPVRGGNGAWRPDGAALARGAAPGLTGWSQVSARSARPRRSCW